MIRAESDALPKQPLLFVEGLGSSDLLSLVALLSVESISGSLVSVEISFVESVSGVLLFS